MPVVAAATGRSGCWSAARFCARWEACRQRRRKAWTGAPTGGVLRQVQRYSHLTHQGRCTEHRDGMVIAGFREVDGPQTQLCTVEIRYGTRQESTACPAGTTWICSSAMIRMEPRATRCTRGRSCTVQSHSVGGWSAHTPTRWCSLVQVPRCSVLHCGRSSGPPRGSRSQLRFTQRPPTAADLCQYSNMVCIMVRILYQFGGAGPLAPRSGVPTRGDGLCADQSLLRAGKIVGHQSMSSGANGGFHHHIRVGCRARQCHQLLCCAAVVATRGQVVDAGPVSCSSGWAS